MAAVRAAAWTESRGSMGVGRVCGYGSVGVAGDMCLSFPNPNPNRNRNPNRNPNRNHDLAIWLH